MTTIKNVAEKKKFKNLIGLLSANKIDNCNRGRGGKKRKKFERIYRISKKTKIINAFLE